MDRPIIFSAPMVRSLLDGRKSQTRRVLKRPTDHFHASLTEARIDATGRLWWWDGLSEHSRRVSAPPYAPGDRLYVREACHLPTPGVAHLMYRADHPDAVGIRWRPSIHMPRWASRITLTVTEVRVQRLQEISAADSIAEGVECETCTAMGQSACHGRGCFASIDAYRHLWNSLHGPDAWDANPWVVAVSFTVEKRNIDHG